MTLTIPDTDHGKIRVFSVASPADGLLEIKIEALVATFGSAPLNTDFVDVIDLDVLEEMSLLDYLSEGYDVEPDDADVAALTALEGVVVLIMSRGHEGAEITLVPAEGVRYVTTLGRGARMTVAASLESEAAQGVVTDGSGKAPKSDARIGGMVAMVALLVMFALVALMVWVGG